MQKLTSCLWFDGQAEAAVEFYRSVFPESKVLEVVRWGAGGMGPEGSVLTILFELNGQEFLALNGGPQYHFTEAISYIVNCETQEEVDRYWAQLTADGGEPGPCGWLKDKFGLSWQVVPSALNKWLGDSDPQKVGRVTQALLKMGKLDIAELERAYEGK